MSAMPPPPGSFINLRGVAFANDHLVFAVGDSGLILRSNDTGKTWREVPRSGAKYFLGDVVFTDSLTGLAMGDHGGCLSTTDGGLTWTRESQTYPGTFNSPVFLDSLHGWVAGNYTTIL